MTNFLTMEIRKNRIKKYFQQGKSTFGIWNAISDTYVAEICGGAGFDWVLVDAEHAPYDPTSILHSIQALASHNTGIMVRPPSHDATYIKKLLDFGVQSFLIPLVETKEQAELLVSAIHYPPKGIRGVGAGESRAAQWSRVKDYYKKVSDELCLMVQVESIVGLQNIEAISSVDGIDGVFIGPADLAATMNMLGRSTHDDVRKEVRRGLSAIVDAGKVAGTLALEEKIIQEYLDAGASFIGIGIDSDLLARRSEELAKKWVTKISS